MQLHYANASPFARKTLVALHETNQLDDVELIAVKSSPIDANPLLAAHNPLGKIPTLTRPDGPAIYDSRVICQYLNARAKAALYPDRTLWETLTLEATADGIMDAAVLIVYEARTRPENLQSTDWTDAQWSKITRALETLNTQWISHLCGPLDMGQIAVACALGYLDFRHDARNWRKGRDTLAQWHDRFCARDSMTATKPA